MKTNIFLIVLCIVIVGVVIFFSRKKKPATTTSTTANNQQQPVKNNIVNPVLEPEPNPAIEPTQPEPDIRALTKDEIKLWQAYLLSKGYNLGNTGLLRNGVDGLWGDYTAAATKAVTGKTLINYQEYKFYIAKDLASKINVDSAIKLLPQDTKELVVNPILPDEEKEEFFMPDFSLIKTSADYNLKGRGKLGKGLEAGFILS